MEPQKKKKGITIFLYVVEKWGGERHDPLWLRTRTTIHKVGNREEEAHA